MKSVPISAGGQIAIPVSIRRRWGTRRVQLIDRGEEILIRPVPDDPISAAAGSLAAFAKPGTNEIRALLRSEEREREDSRYRPRGDRAPRRRVNILAANKLRRGE